MLTKETYLKLVEDKLNYIKKSPYYGSEGKPLFDEEGEFNKDNWNGLDLLRFYCLDVRDGNIKDDRVHVVFDEDDWLATIIIEGKYGEDIYNVCWYKSRGRTELIYKNRHLITIDEYIEILNILEVNYKDYVRSEEKEKKVKLTLSTPYGKFGDK